MSSTRSDRRLGLAGPMSWALGLALLLSAVRALVLARFAPEGLDAGGLAACLLRVPGHLLLGTLLGLFVLRSRGLPARALCWLLVAIFVATDIAASHYEAVFGALPGFSMLGRLGELVHLRSSVAAVAPTAWVLAELGLTLLLLVALAARLRRGPRGEVLPRADGRSFAFGGAMLATCLGFVLVAHSSRGALPHQLTWASRTPLIWAVVDALPKESASAVEEGAARRLQAYMGHRPPFADDPLHPLCARAPREAPRPGNGRSVILVLLESVGRVELNARHEGRAVMPRLRRIVDEHFHSERFFAAGAYSAQALVAIMTGFPAQTAGRVLWTKPLPSFQGLPADLRSKGYRTAYLHGAELSFEQQSAFLEMVGFVEVLGEAPRRGEQMGSWGVPDGDMFEKTEDWIRAHREENGDAPFFLTLATLSTHHPYGLPDSWSSVFSGHDDESRFLDALAYLDAELGAFHEWYVEQEAGRGTLLVLVGDHPPQMDFGMAARAGRPQRFDTLFAVVGLPEEHAARTRELAVRLAGQHDLPSTLRGLLDIEPGRCEQGLDLFAEDWPEDRLTYSMSGDLHEIHVRQGDRLARVDRRRSEAELLERGSSLDDEGAARFLDEVSGFVTTLLPINGLLLTENRHGPRRESLELRREPLPEVERTRVVAHRGNWSLEGGGRENRLDNILGALEAGFEWIEVDVVLTSDGIPVLEHDLDLRVGGELVPVFSMSLAELRALPGFEDLLTLEELLGTLPPEVGLLIELKPQRFVDATLRLAERVCELLEGRPRESHLVDSFSITTIGTIRDRCGVPIALDTPFQREVGMEWLEAAILHHVDWLYVDRSVASPELVAAARQVGLRIMVYTINDPAELRRYEGNWPDGILTDRVEVARELARLQGPG